MTIAQMAVAVPVLLALGGCATWSHSEVQPAAQKAAEPRPATSPEAVLVTEGDIADRPYQSLGDISVTVNKTTIFHPDPTKELVAVKLREEAAKLGADAVVHVRYGTVGISFMSWGSLDGKGRAVVFK